jgi:hypothetical protein
MLAHDGIFAPGPEHFRSFCRDCSEDTPHEGFDEFVTRSLGRNPVASLCPANIGDYWFSPRCSAPSFSSSSRNPRKPALKDIDDLVANLGRREGDPIYKSTSAIELIFGADDHFIGISIHGDKALRFLNLLPQIIDGHGLRSPFRSLDPAEE